MGMEQPLLCPRFSFGGFHAPMRFFAAPLMSGTLRQVHGARFYQRESRGSDIGNDLPNATQKSFTSFNVFITENLENYKS